MPCDRAWDALIGLVAGLDPLAAVVLGDNRLSLSGIPTVQPQRRVDQGAFTLHNPASPGKRRGHVKGGRLSCMGVVVSIAGVWLMKSTPGSRNSRKAAISAPKEQAKRSHFQTRTQSTRRRRASAIKASNSGARLRLRTSPLA